MEAASARDDRNDREFLLHANQIDNLPPTPRRYLRDFQNPIESLNEGQFLQRYRFSKYVFMDVVFPILSEELANDNKRGLPLPPLLKMLTVLRFFATGCFQMVCGDLLHIHQSTVCRLIKYVANLLARKIPQFVKFPQNLTEVRMDFYKMAHFPGVIGCLDCTHVPVQNPGRGKGEQFRNRKGWLSVNVQVVVGPEGQMFDLVARWPGSVHDSRIFDNSALKVRLEARELKGLLLGDSGYGQSEYLFTPASEPVNPREANYNRAHRSTRNCIERCFGRWKKRFPCLSCRLNTKIETSIIIISACALLHNLAVDVNDPLPNGELEDLFQQPQVPPHNDRARGRAIRNAFIATHF